MASVGRSADGSGEVIVNHVGLTVSDLERSVAFYRDVVGLALDRRTEPDGSEWFRTLTDNPDARIRSAVMSAGGFRLQLVEYEAGGIPGSAAGHAEVGAPHLCVNVTDLDLRFERVAGTHRVSPVVDIAGTGNRSFYVLDPDGVPVELLQPALPGRWP